MSVEELEKLAWGIMRKTIAGYEALKGKLESWSNGTLPDDITGFRNRLLSNLDDWLGELQDVTKITLRKTYTAHDTSKDTRGILYQAQNTIVLNYGNCRIHEDFWIFSTVIKRP